MLVWIEGALNPQQINNHVLNDHDYPWRQQLLNFLDNTIQNDFPVQPLMSGSMADDFHPCTIWCHLDSHTPTQM
jgi:hypothetical protein